jgi:hypothetical protein
VAPDPPPKPGPGAPRSSAVPARRAAPLAVTKRCRRTHWARTRHRPQVERRVAEHLGGGLEGDGEYLDHVPARRTAKYASAVPCSALAEAGVGFADVVRARHVLPRAESIPACSPTLWRASGDVLPAATMIAAGPADRRLRIEIEATARRPVGAE